MESSTVLAFRIFVMLSCLIIVPLAAIFGSAFPDVVKSQLVDRIVALSTGKPVETAPPAADPNGFRAVTAGAATAGPVVEAPAADWQGAPRWDGAAEASAWPAGNTPAVVPVGGPAPTPGYTQSASFTAPVDGPQQPAVQPAASGYPAPAAIPAPASPPAAVDRTACPLEQPDRFTEMERRLREYGATYYLLETWGSSGELYRFHCRMAVASNAAYSRHFEATDPDALKAMNDVLAQVEAWRSGAAH